MGRDRLLGFLWSFIPERIPNGVVLFVYDCLSRRGEAKYAGIPRIAPSLLDPGPLPYIEDQRRRTGERYGCVTVAYAGCEAIAAYNAFLCLAGAELVSFEALLAHFGHDGMALGGRWGTSPRAVERLLRGRVLAPPAEISATADRERFDALAEGCRLAVVSFYNDRRDIRRGVHTICLTRGAGGFIAHNLTEDGTARGPFGSVTAAMGPRAAGLYLIAVRSRPEKEVFPQGSL